MTMPNSKVPRVDKKIPTTILTGFLGSGKTTLLNYILKEQHGKRIAVIENEFGDQDIDKDLVADKEHTEDQVIEMMNGCVCCTVRQDLIKALIKIYDMNKGKKPFDAVIIETTGLADPAPVAQTFFVNEQVAEWYSLDGIITLVDAKHIIEHLDDEKPEGVENEAVEQLAFADRVLLNKIDLVDEEYLKKVEGRIRQINDSVEIIRTQNSVCDVNKLMFIEGFSLKKTLEKEPEFLSVDEEHEHEHDSSVSSVGIKIDGDINVRAFEMLVESYIIQNGADIFRSKGRLSIVGTKKKFVFQGIHMLIQAGLTDDEWREGEKRESTFVLIGRNLKRDHIESLFEQCKQGPLRFAVGDKVEAKVAKEEYSAGTVIKTWDKMNPYRIQLATGEECWGPIDDDFFVKKQGSQVNSKIGALLPSCA